MNELKEYYLSNTKRGIHKFPHYMDIYDFYFKKFRFYPDTNVLEIGVGEGGCLQMWKHYFGVLSKIYGIDCVEESRFAEDQIKVFIGKQGDVPFLQSIIKEAGHFDVVIDDGSHKCDDQITSFETLFPCLSEGGIYLIEDLQMAYAEEYGGGYKKYSSTIEYFKDLIDYFCGYYMTDRGDNARDISRHIYSINYFTNVIVVEKRDKTLTHVSPIRTGKPR